MFLSIYIDIITLFGKKIKKVVDKPKGVCYSVVGTLPPSDGGEHAEASAQYVAN